MPNCQCINPPRIQPQANIACSAFHKPCLLRFVPSGSGFFRQRRTQWKEESCLRRPQWMSWRMTLLAPMLPIMISWSPSSPVSRPDDQNTLASYRNIWDVPQGGKSLGERLDWLHSGSMGSSSLSLLGMINSKTRDGQVDIERKREKGMKWSEMKWKTEKTKERNRSKAAESNIARDKGTEKKTMSFLLMSFLLNARVPTTFKASCCCCWDARVCESKTFLIEYDRFPWVRCAKGSGVPKGLGEKAQALGNSLA